MKEGRSWQPGEWGDEKSDWEFGYIEQISLLFRQISQYIENNCIYNYLIYGEIIYKHGKREVSLEPEVLYQNWKYRNEQLFVLSVQSLPDYT